MQHANNDLPKIGKPAERALQRAGLTTLEQIARANDTELLSLHGVGPKALRILREAIMSKQKTCSRGHTFVGSGPCPVCWPGSRRKS
ncbi:hypothetical protein HY374_03800 [Candidatus Berkelbacteria bacterium]|nr:hypothetical protein [Candidatus Berkelbacteria bacterium]